MKLASGFGAGMGKKQERAAPSAAPSWSSA